MAEVVQLQAGTLADRINAEHDACVAAVGQALDHGIEAGRLLSEVKASLPHGEWLPWLEANFAGSVRNAQGYMRLHDRREEVVKMRNGVTHLSLRAALKALAVPKKEVPLHEHNLPFDPATTPGPDPDVLRGMEEEQAAWAEWRQRQQARNAQLRLLYDKAGEQARVGDPAKPEGLKAPDEEWRKAYAGAVAWRNREVALKMAELLNLLDPLIVSEQDGYRPEEAGEALARLTGEGRALTVLREGTAWLQRVLAEAEG